MDIAGPGLPARSEVSIQTELTDNQQAVRFAASLADAFADSGHSVRDAASVTAVFGFTQRSRATGTADASPAAEGQQPAITWISAPVRKSAFQACEGERLRATLALYSRVEKILIYRGTGEIDGCSFTQAGIDPLAKVLVKGASR